MKVISTPWEEKILLRTTVLHLNNNGDNSEYNQRLSKV